jgi:hypothetical protein
VVVSSMSRPPLSSGIPEWPATRTRAPLRELGGAKRLRRARLGNTGRTTGEDTTMTERQLDGAEAILAEARKTKETAERMANGEGPPGEADDIRVLAGMIHQVAEQVERLAGVVSGGSAPLADPRESDT